MIIKENSIFKYYIKLTYKTIILAIFILLSLYSIEIIQPIVGEKIITILNQKIAVEVAFNKILDVIIVYLLLDIGIGLLLYIKNMVFENLSRSVTRKLRVDILETIVNFKYQKTVKYDSGYLYARVGDGEKVAKLFSKVFPKLISNIVYICIILLVLSKVSPVIAAIVTFAVVVVFAIIALFFILGRKYLGKGNQFKDAKNIHYIQTMNGIKQIKTHRIGKIFLQKLATLNDGEYKNYMKKEVINTSVESLLTLGENIAIAMILIKGVTTHSGNISIGELYLCISYIRKLFIPIFSVVEDLDNAQRGFSSYLRICKFMNEDKEFNKYNVYPPLKEKIEKIEFSDVSFSYVKNQNLFKNLSFIINEKEIVAITGENGVGKRTLTNLFLKLYKVKTGKILINGKNINNLSANSIRKKIIYIEQEPEIFVGTVEDNITLLDKKVDKVKLHKVIKKTKLDYLLNKNINEMGKNLTYGQKQMIALARAMYKGGEIIIWDEPTSTLDFETEKTLNSCIKEISKNKTLIIIAHRMSTIKKCPKVLNITKDGVFEYAGNEIK